MKSVLVLGASGFIGSHIVEKLSATCRVTGVDVLASAQQPGNYTFIQGNLEAALLQQILADTPVDIVIYAAGRASVQHSFTDPFADFSENSVVAFTVLDVIRRCSPTTKLIFLSSAAVYGNPQKLPVAETDTLNPISPYGFHKLQTESIAREFYTCFGIASAGLRIFSCYGEGQRKLLLWDLCNKAASGKTVLLKGVGAESRDFIHVKDVAACVQHFVETGFEGHEMYNLASGNESSIRDIASRVLACFRDGHQLQFEGKKNEGNPDNWVADISKLKKRGFSCNISLDKGISDYVAWFKDVRQHEK
jgi:UDP-glucose 4-epimerase